MTKNQEPVAKSVRLVCGSFGRCQRRVRIAPDQGPRSETRLSISLSSEDMDGLRELAEDRDTSPEELAARWLSVNIQLMMD